MSVVIETTIGDITVDLFVKERPKAALNFIKLCKLKYYNFNLFHTIQHGFVAQTGDPTGTGDSGKSVWGVLEGSHKRFFEPESVPKIKHTEPGLLSMVGSDDNMVGSQFLITLGPDLTSLDGKHCVIGEVTEGHDVLRKLNEAICDETHRPYQDIRITHTVILDDPFSNPRGFRTPSRSPSPSVERLQGGRIAADEEINDTEGKTDAEVAEMLAEREAKARATILEIVGDLPDADIAPPENVLFVCKLNPVTTDDDLQIIFSRFGKIKGCEVIRDKASGDSLQYAFIEFENRRACEDAYFKMDNVLIDDRRIHVDFSQSVSKMKWRGKGKGIEYSDGNENKSYRELEYKSSRRRLRAPSRLRRSNDSSNSRSRSKSKSRSRSRSPKRNKRSSRSRNRSPYRPMQKRDFFSREYRFQGGRSSGGHYRVLRYARGRFDYKNRPYPDTRRNRQPQMPYQQRRRSGSRGYDNYRNQRRSRSPYERDRRNNNPRRSRSRSYDSVDSYRKKSYSRERNNKGRQDSRSPYDSNRYSKQEARYRQQNPRSPNNGKRSPSPARNKRRISKSPIDIRPKKRFSYSRSPEPYRSRSRQREPPKATNIKKRSPSPPSPPKHIDKYKEKSFSIERQIHLHQQQLQQHQQQQQQQYHQQESPQPSVSQKPPLLTKEKSNKKKSEKSKKSKKHRNKSSDSSASNSDSASSDEKSKKKKKKSKKKKSKKSKKYSSSSDDSSSSHSDDSSGNEKRKKSKKKK
uniref:peptidylprolyl isomerase n=1 Tax=Corethrella appendiculata TaxID=1370023 RepID=U5EWX9_9DIPT